MAIEEIEYALLTGNSVVAIKITEYDNFILKEMGVPIIPKRKDTLEKWIYSYL